MALSFGAPVNAGAYVSTVIVLDKNAEVYVARAYLASESNYRADIAVRNFTISKGTSTIEITSTTNKAYDGNAYEVETTAKGRNGKNIEDTTVKYTYYKGIKKLTSASVGFFIFKLHAKGINSMRVHHFIFAEFYFYFEIAI